MTPERLKQLRAHAEAHRHVTTTMALELLEHVAQLEAEAAKWKHRTGVMADREGAALSRAESAEALVRELHQKLAIAGVEGSPPPGQDTTIGQLSSRAHAAEAALRVAREALQTVLIKGHVLLAFAGTVLRWKTQPGVDFTDELERVVAAGKAIHEAARAALAPKEGA